MKEPVPTGYETWRKQEMEPAASASANACGFAMPRPSGSRAKKLAKPQAIAETVAAAPSAVRSNESVLPPSSFTPSSSILPGVGSLQGVADLADDLRQPHRLREDGKRPLATRFLQKTVVPAQRGECTATSRETASPAATSPGPSVSACGLSNKTRWTSSLRTIFNASSPSPARSVRKPRGSKTTRNVSRKSESSSVISRDGV